MAFSTADIDALDRAIASGVLEVRFADGRTVKYRTMEELMRARGLAAGAVPSTDPTQRPGGVSYAEWGGGF